ncbi:MAG TPA: YciI family protein [Croceibacterium sp.]|nr:YciI family protein [Croceibacterium sp.]
MFIVSLTYTAPLDVLDSHLPAHVAWLDEGLAQGWLLLAGRKVPRTGGILIARGEREEVERLVANDPFVLNGVATTELIEFQPSRVAPDVTLGSLLG